MRQRDEIVSDDVIELYNKMVIEIFGLDPEEITNNRMRRLYYKKSKVR